MLGEQLDPQFERPTMTKPSLKSTVTEHFGFLVAEHGFACSRMSAGLVRFESDAAFVEIVYDGSYTYELDVWFGLRHNEGDRYTIQDVLELNRETTGQPLRTLQVTTEESMATCLRTLAEQVKSQATDVLRGDRSAFKALAMHQARRIEEYALSWELTYAREKARAAWGNREFETLVSALEPHQAHLTMAETAKLTVREKDVGAMRVQLLGIVSIGCPATSQEFSAVTTGMKP